MAKRKRCKTPKCSKVAEVRGVCRACYLDHWRAVKAGEETWTELEAKKLVDAKPESKAAIARRAC